MRLLNIAVVVLLAGVLCATAAENVARPNIVVLLCDDLGYGDLGCYGHPAIRTPNLDRLAGEGVKFTHCYSASPVCSPSRAGLMTGRTPNRAGIRDWIPPNTGIYLRPKEVTIAQLLRKGGYQTCHVGKWHLNSRTDGSEPTPNDAGFEHSFYTQNNAAPNHLNPVNFVRNGARVGKLQGPSSHLVVQEAIGWLKTVTNQPFYLNVWFHEPHELVVAAEEFLDLYPSETNQDRRHYYADVSQMDAAVGKLLRYLDERGWHESTLVFFTSDNGPETLLRYPTGKRSYGSAGGLRGMKLHVTEGGYRVPGILRWPGHAKPGTASEEPVCSLDLLPTFCELAGVEPPRDRALDGTSLVSFLAGKPLRRTQPLYWQYDSALSTPWVVSMRDGPWKILADARLERFQLFNLTGDIAEQKDLASQEVSRLRRMSAVLKQLHAEVGEDAAKSGNPDPLAQRRK